PRRGEMLARDDEVAVRRPVGLVERAEVFLGYLAWARSVSADGPDIVAAAAVGGECDLLPVRRIARLHVPGIATGKRPRLAAFDRNHIEVAQQVERNLASVRGHVEAKPGPGARFD